MASEYLKKKYQDVKPDEEIELTPAQKRRNWWYYHKGMVIFGAVLALGTALLIRDIFFHPAPDYQIGYISTTPLPSEVLASLQEQIESLGEDVNGDGRVLAEIFTYDLGFDAQGMIDVEAASSGITRLTVDLSTGKLYLIILDDPEGFQARMGALSYLDGSTPPLDDPAFGAEDWRSMVYLWDDCPVLSGLELGTYTAFLDLEEREIDGQTAMAGLYVGRRALWDESQKDAFAADELLWQSLTAGAPALQQ